MTMVMLIIQSAIINYERAARRIAVVKIMGYKFWDRYMKSIFHFVFTWLIIGSALVWVYFPPKIELDFSRFSNRLRSFIDEYNRFGYIDLMLIFAIVGIFVLLDMVITALSFKLIESKRVVTTLKGET
jgi:hypothetical protein